MEIAKLRGRLDREKSRLGLVCGRLNIEEYDEFLQQFEAYISPQSWDVTLKIGKGFNPTSTRRQRAYARKRQIADGLEELISDAFLHEIAHWELPFSSGRGCPYDVYHHDKILEAVKQGLPADKQQHAGYVANMFEDLMINPRVREWKARQGENALPGLVLFYDNEGERYKQQGMKSYTPAYEAFVKLNMHLWGDNLDRALLKRHFSNERSIDDAVRGVISDLNLPEDIEDTEVLFRKKAWQRMAENFAKRIAPLLETPPVERLSAYSSQNKAQSNSEEGKESRAGNGVEEGMRTEEGKEEIAYGRYSSGDRLSPNFTSYEQLDALYRRLARSIPVRVEAMTKRSALEIAPLNYQAFDPEVHDPRHIKPKLMINDEGRVTLAVPKDPLTIEVRSKVQRRSFPDFKLMVLDNSGSMRGAPDGSNNAGSTRIIPWGDNSKYHYALLGFYGIENFLQRQGIAQYIKHGVALFSNSTRYKESGFRNIDEVRRFALNPEWAGTYIDASVLRDALQGRESLVLSISDGGVHNWSSEREKIKQLIENNYFAHIQIGQKNDFTRDLESWGVPVYYVSSGQDLSRLMVDVTTQTYRRFVQQ